MKQTGYLDQLDVLLEQYLVKKAPSLPEGFKNIVVDFGPWISLVLGVMLLPVVLTVFGLGTMFGAAGMMFGARFGAAYMFGAVVTLVQTVLQFLAIPGLMKKQVSGWKYAFYGVLVGMAASLVRFDLGGLIIGGGLGLYVLYQVKSYYK